MTPNTIRNHCGQHKCNWIVAPGTRTRTCWSAHINVLSICIELCTQYPTCTGPPSSAACRASAANQLIKAFAAGWSAVQNGTPPVSDLTQPQRIGLGKTCLAMMDWPHTYPAWSVLLLMCSTKAAFVGGRYSKVLDD